MISRSFRVALSALLFAGALGLASTGAAQAQSVMKQCADEWQAAKENNTTNGRKWAYFLQQCRLQKEAGAPAAAPATAPAPAPAPLSPAPAPTYQPKPKPMQAALPHRQPANSPRRRKPRADAATTWSGSTPRASPTPTITRAAAGTAQRSRAPICARPTLGPPAITRRRARRNSKSRCSRDRRRAARKLRGRHSAFIERARCIGDLLGLGVGWRSRREPIVEEQR